jgi:uncharacterized protein YceK
MKKLILLAVAMILLSGCYGFKVERTINAQGIKSCSYNVVYSGNSMVGYKTKADYDFTKYQNEKCAEWMQK